MCKVSVIVPVYNVERYLRACLDSLIHQTLREIEIICVDDGSTDESLSILQNYKEKDDRITILHQENLGQSSARNRGLDLAKGRYVYFCDSDDYLCSDALEVCYKTALKYDLDVLRFGYNEFVDGKADLLTPKECFTVSNVISGIDMLSYLRRHHSMTPGMPFLFIRRTEIEKHQYRFIEGIIREDHAFFTEVFMTAKRALHLEIPLYYRRVREGSTMTSPNEYKSARGFLVTVEHFLANKNSKVKGELKKQIYLFYRHFIIYYLRTTDEEKDALCKEVEHLRKTLSKVKYLHSTDMWLFCNVNFNLYLLYIKTKRRDFYLWRKLVKPLWRFLRN